ncbi:MAG: hypothetical protein EU550_01735 [Promethearchaeota archaeon]|nr:MAG: hypothetical protein EU550_01735 [Candidatus Lokiarchaeota archaeon]
MLRQIHIFYKKERIFTHNYALALGVNELENVLKIITSYMEAPMPGKIFQKPLSNFQVFHQGKGKVYYLMITDQIDSLQYVNKIFNQLVKKFDEIYPNPLEISQENQKREDFLQYLNQLQKDFHSKVAIVGPLHAGKTTLYNMLKVDDTERNIMDFAKSSNFILDNLSFDLWDFQLQDNSSLLWSKFVSGSDLIIIVFDISNYNLKILEKFLNLKRREGNLSKLLILGNKVDLVNKEYLKRIKNDLKIQNYHLISLEVKDSNLEVLNLIRNVLNLKQSLPHNFDPLLNKSKTLEKEGKLVEAVKTYKELIEISNQNQLFSYLKNFENKIFLLNKKIQEGLELKRKVERKKKFAAPQQIKFSKKVKVKNLPGGLDELKSSKKNLTPLPKRSKQKSSKDELEISPEDIKSNLQLIGKRNPMKENIEKSPKELKTENKSIGDPSIILKKMIEDKGSTLSLNLCNLYLSEMEQSLGRPLEYSDIEAAAEVFVKQEQTS